MLTNAPILKQPEDNKLFVLSTDASSYALGSVLEQYDHENNLRPIAFHSRRFQPTERNYMNYEREALSLVDSIKHFRLYLLGKRFIAFTDNSAVASLLKSKDNYGRVTRWIHIISEYDVEIKHRAGNDKVVADYLSQLQQGKDLLLYTQDKINKKKSLKIPEELLETLKVLHDRLGHFGVHAVWTWIKNRYTYPNLYKEIQNYIRSCEKCQDFNLKKPSYRFFGESEISRLFHRWSFDFSGPFPRSETGNRYLFVRVEAFTGYPIAEPCTSATAIAAYGSKSFRLRPI
ncbi:Retrovirus-related Pol polyprotein from transposon [Smittium culicis]|uniref:Retrovirus-related Pol polyprotein from transposon n=1 Tax=Smittium culicis TaxID=133412 RepID=A0A1R1XQI5_9FUNG|nr:Retrovirus-related Pol polyprotein from transposon [Smittium culicis]